jgi:hypothetical protein
MNVSFIVGHERAKSSISLYKFYFVSIVNILMWICQSYVTTDGQSASLSWCQTPTSGPRPDFYYCQTVAGLLMWGTHSDERAGLSFTISAGPRQRSHSRFPVHRDSWPYFTVSDSRLPQPGGTCPYVKCLSYSRCSHLKHRASVGFEPTILVLKRAKTFYTLDRMATVIGYVKCSTLYNGDGLRLTVCVCYSWEMALNIGRDVSFDNM